MSCINTKKNHPMKTIGSETSQQKKAESGYFQLVVRTLC